MFNHVFAPVFAPKQFFLMVRFRGEKKKHVFLKFYSMEFLKPLNKCLKGPRSPSNAPERPKYLFVGLWFLLSWFWGEEMFQKRKMSVSKNTCLWVTCLQHGPFWRKSIWVWTFIGWVIKFLIFPILMKTEAVLGDSPAYIYFNIWNWKNINRSRSTPLHHVQ